MNMQALLKQAQSLQKDMLKEQEKINSTIFEGENSLVKVKMNGKKQILEVIIDKSSSLESDDIEKMGKFANGMPGLF